MVNGYEKRKPAWLKVRYRYTPGTRRVKKLVKKYNLHTVCSSAGCPNLGECWGRGTATFMILGKLCTRNCYFCGVKFGNPLPVDKNEPYHVAEAVKELGLRHVVITSVTRDDLPDGGASIFIDTINLVREVSSGTTVEILTPDFGGNVKALDGIIDIRPDIFNHNLETVERLTTLVRSSASYEQSLFVLRYIAQGNSGIVIKSGLMLGLGERREEVIETMKDLVNVGCKVLSLGQYLQPSKNHLSVVEYISPGEFSEFREIGLGLGFEQVYAGPLVRSSYMAESYFDFGGN